MQQKKWVSGTLNLKFDNMLPQVILDFTGISKF